MDTFLWACGGKAGSGSGVGQASVMTNHISSSLPLEKAADSLMRQQESSEVHRHTANVTFEMLNIEVCFEYKGTQID